MVKLCTTSKNAPRLKNDFSKTKKVFKICRKDPNPNKKKEFKLIDLFECGAP